MCLARPILDSCSREQNRQVNHHRPGVTSALHQPSRLKVIRKNSRLSPTGGHKLGPEGTGREPVFLALSLVLATPLLCSRVNQNLAGTGAWGPLHCLGSPVSPSWFLVHGFFFDRSWDGRGRNSPRSNMDSQSSPPLGRPSWDHGASWA